MYPIGIVCVEFKVRFAVLQNSGNIIPMSAIFYNIYFNDVTLFLTRRNLHILQKFTATCSLLKIVCLLFLYFLSLENHAKVRTKIIQEKKNVLSPCNCWREYLSEVTVSDILQ